jgi:hypothetical protein
MIIGGARVGVGGEELAIAVGNDDMRSEERSGRESRAHHRRIDRKR